MNYQQQRSIMTVEDDVDYFLLSSVSPPPPVEESSVTIVNEDGVRSSSSYIGMNGLSVYSSLPPPSPHDDEEELSTVTGLNAYALPPQEEQVSSASEEEDFVESQHAADVHVKNTITNTDIYDNFPPIHHIHSPHHIVTDPSRLRDRDIDNDGVRNFGMVDLDAEEVHIKFPLEKDGINQDNPTRYIPDTAIEEGGGEDEEIEAVARAPNEEGKVVCQNVDGAYGSFRTDDGVMVRYQYEVSVDYGVDIYDVIPVIEPKITDALLPVFFKDKCLDEYSESSLRGGGLRGGERRLQLKLSGIDMNPLDILMETGCNYPDPDPMSKCYVIEGGVTLHFPPKYSSEMLVQGAQLSTLNALRESMSYGHLNIAHSSINKLRLSDSSYSKEPDVLTRDELEKKDDGNGGRGLQILGILVGVGLMICCCFCGCGFLFWWRHKIAAADDDDSLGKTKLKKTKKKKTRYSSDDEDEQSSIHRKKKKKRKHKKKKNLLLDDDDEEYEEDGSNRRRKMKNKDTFPHTRKKRDSSARSDPYSEQLIRDLKASEEMNAAVGDEGSVSSSVRRRKKKKKKKKKRKKAKKKRSQETLDSDNTDTDNTNTDTDGENTKETTTSSDSTTDNSSTTGSKEAMSTTSSSGDDDDNNSTTTSASDDNGSTTTSTSEDEDEDDFDQSGGAMSQSNFMSQRRGIRQQRRAGPPPTRFNFTKARSARNYRMVFGSGGTDGDDNESVMTGGTGMHSQASAATAQVKNMPSCGSFFNDDTSVMTGISATTQMMSNTGRAATPLAMYFGNGSGSDSEPSNTGRSRVSDPSRHSSKHGSGSDSEPSNAGRSRVSDPSRHSSKHGSGSDSEPSNAGRSRGGISYASSHGGTSKNSDPSRHSSKHGSGSDSEPSNAGRGHGSISRTSDPSRRSSNESGSNSESSNAVKNRFHISLTTRQSTGSGSDSEPSNTSTIPPNLRISYGSDRTSFASKDSGPSRTSSR